MNKLSILRTLIDFTFYISCLTVLVLVLFVPIAALGYANELPIKMNGQSTFINNWQSKLLLVFVLISSLFFIYSIYLLRKTIAFFAKRDIFNSEVIQNFNIIGICVITSSLLLIIPSFFYQAVEESSLEISIQSGFDSPILIISLGLFFMVLSEVFQKAKNLKEENDLTL
jgi:hypothetical protein